VSVSATVVVPTYNERTNLPVLVAGLMPIDGVRLLVVDDQSPDGTADVAEALARDHPGRIEVMRRSGPRASGVACGYGRRLGRGRPVRRSRSLPSGELPASCAGTDRSRDRIAYVPGGAVGIASSPLLSRLATRTRARTRLTMPGTSGYRCFRRRAASMALEARFGRLFARSKWRSGHEPGAGSSKRRLRSSAPRGESRCPRVILESAIMPSKLVWSRRAGIDVSPDYYRGRKVMIRRPASSAVISRAGWSSWRRRPDRRCLIADYGGNLFNIDGRPIASA
jgi:hypothetical protein